jgi:uncharacterized protein YuzB (UPF0349 family)
LASSMSLKWCKRNLAQHSGRVYDMIREEYPEIEMEVVDCANVCGLCPDVPFVVRNNSVMAARDERSLYVKIKKGMEFLSSEPLPGTYAAAVAASKPVPVPEAIETPGTAHLLRP